MQQPIVNRQVIVNKPAPGEQAYYTLKAKLQELQSQVEDVQERRDELAQQLDQRSGADRAGVEARLGILDNRLVQLETEMGSVGKDAAQIAPTSLSMPEPVRIYRGYDEEDMWGAGLSGGFFMLLAFAIVSGIRRFRRRKWAPQSTNTPGAGSEKIDRMEQSIDSIAVEVERISENQRFMTRLLTETQLAGTIAAVRGSAEAAKAAVETQSNV